MDHKQQEQVALHRWAVIAEAASDRLTAAERGALVRQLAARPHAHPDGSSRRYSRVTIDRWLRAWRAGGLDALRPAERSDAGVVRAHPELFAEACALRLELPGRSAAQIASILYHRHGIRVAERTIRAQLRRAGLHREALAAEPKAYGRYEAARPNERWITDVLVGPWVPWPRREGSVRARLFLIVDDHSRLLVDGRFFAHENARACQELLRRAVTRRGLPQVFYCDNGAPFSNAWLARTCAVLGIRLVHSQPYSPEGRGKQERLNRYIREAFLAEAVHHGIESLDQLNDLFAAWAEHVCNRRVHAETGQRPIDRFQAGGPHRQADPALLREAFRWSVTRKVTRTATVPLEGNAYAVDPALTGRRVELRYDPEDLSAIEVFLDGKPAGAATPTGPSPKPPGLSLPPPVSTTWAWWPPPTTRRPAPARRSTSRSWACSPPPARRASHDPGALGCPLRAGAHPVRQADRRQGPVRPPGPRRGGRPDQLLRRRSHAGGDDRGRRCGQKGGAARRRGRPGPHPPPGHLHRQPRLRHPRPLRDDRPGAGRPAPLPQGRADGPGIRPARRRDRRKTPPRRSDLRRGSSAAARPAGGAAAADQLGDGFLLPVRRHPGRAAHPQPAAADGHVRRPGPADRHPVHGQADGPRRIRRLPAASPGAGRAGRAVVRR